MSAVNPTLTHLKHAIALDASATKSLIKPNPLLSNALSNSTKNNLPAIQISPLAGQYLSLQLRLMNAKTVLEIGTLGGYSTIWFAQSMPGIHVTSIELNPHHHSVAHENTRDLENVELILGSALDVLPKLVSEGRKFDFVFLDASWDEQWQYFERAIELTRVGGAIFVDNVVRTVIEDLSEGKDEETLVERVGRDGRVDATLVTTVTSQKSVVEDNIDGFLLAVVKEV
jgi:predicted O-methyltransferase YrrM